MARSTENVETRADAGTLAVIGSRGVDPDEVPFAIDTYLNGHSRVVSGGARGVDRAAEVYAASLGLSVVSYRPDRLDGKYIVEKFVDGAYTETIQHPKTGRNWTFPDFTTAAKQRNWWIVRDASRVLALWDGMSSGTAHGIAAAYRLGVELVVWMDGDS